MRFVLDKLFGQRNDRNGVADLGDSASMWSKTQYSNNLAYKTGQKNFKTFEKFRQQHSISPKHGNDPQKTRFSDIH